MMRTILAALAVVLVASSTAWAQCGCGAPVTVEYRALSPVPATSDVVTYRPVVSSPVVTYSPVAAPVVTYRPLAPAPVVVYRAPWVTYSPVAPVVTYRPVVPYGPAVYPAAVVRAKVYYPGQPVRNFFRAITP